MSSFHIIQNPLMSFNPNITKRVLTRKAWLCHPSMTSPPLLVSAGNGCWAFFWLQFFSACLTAVSVVDIFCVGGKGYRSETAAALLLQAARASWKFTCGALLAFICPFWDSCRLISAHFVPFLEGGRKFSIFQLFFPFFFYASWNIEALVHRRC